MTTAIQMMSGGTIMVGGNGQNHGNGRREQKARDAARRAHQIASARDKSQGRGGRQQSFDRPSEGALCTSEQLVRIDWTRAAVRPDNRQNLEMDPNGVHVVVAYLKDEPTTSWVVFRGTKDLCSDYLIWNVISPDNVKEARASVIKCFESAIAAQKKLEGCGPDSSFLHQGELCGIIHEQTRSALSIAKAFERSGVVIYRNLAGKVKDLRDSAKIAIGDELLFGLTFHLGQGNPLFTEEEALTIPWGDENVVQVLPISGLTFGVLEAAKKDGFVLSSSFDHAIVLKDGVDDLEGRLLIPGTKIACNMFMAEVLDWVDAQAERLRKEAEYEDLSNTAKDTLLGIWEQVRPKSGSAGKMLDGELFTQYNALVTRCRTLGVKLDNVILVKLVNAALGTFAADDYEEESTPSVASTSQDATPVAKTTSKKGKKGKTAATVAA
jgi:hypothetical protein